MHGWFEATDPAAVRRRQGARAASAALCTWLTVREVTTSVSDRPQTAAVLFGVVACFVVSIVIADPRRRDRLVTTALGAALSIVMVVLAAYTSHVPFVQKLLLLVLVFVSFAARRFGLRAGELAMLAVMTLYFATSSAVSPGNIGWFAFATTVGVLWLAVWQYVLIPYDPRRSLEQAATAFYRRAGELVGDVGTRVASSAATHRLIAYPTGCSNGSSWWASVAGCWRASSRARWRRPAGPAAGCRRCS